MFDEELNRIINDSKNIVIIKVYNKLIRMEELKGGIISSKKFIADELNISSQSVANAIKWLKGSGYVTETKFQGQTQFILNHVSKKSTEKPAKTISPSRLSFTRAAKLSQDLKFLINHLIESAGKGGFFHFHHFCRISLKILQENFETLQEI